MAENISPKQTLFLWRLLAQPEGLFVGTSKPQLTANERNQLVEAKLIQMEKRKATATSRAKSNYAMLTESGWNWAERNLDSPLPKKGDAALIVLQQVFVKLKGKIDTGEISLGRLFAPCEPKIPSNEALPLVEAQKPVEPTPLLDESSEVATEIKRRLYRACFQLSGDGVYGSRIRLADLRSKLADVPRLELDRALQELERTEEASLMPLDDKREIRPDDEEAALSNSHGTNRHVLYLSRPR